MTYLPFARKYRPQTFADLTGQPHVTATLTRALEGHRIAQAYLFSGQRGVGKTSAARILAKCLNCANGPTPAPCQTCASCTQITQGNSLDVIEIDGASNRGIEEIRNLRESVPYAPATGRFRLYIIDEVHMLTTEAFNALLKTLEEPPAHVKFIFATTAPQRVPATVLSRCQRFDFRRIETATIVEVLGRLAHGEGVAIDEAARYAIARAAEGSLRDAEVVLDQLASFARGPIREADVTELLGAVESDAVFGWMQAVLDRDATRALATLLNLMERGRAPLQLLTALTQHVRNLLVMQSAKEAPSREEALKRLIDEPADRLKRLEQQATPLTPQELLLFLQVLTGAYDLVRRSAQAQTVLELVIMKLATREQWQSLDEISRRLERMAGATPQAVLPPGGAASPEPAAALQADDRSETAETPSSSEESSLESSTKPPPGTPEPLHNLWPAFLERLGQQKMSLAAYLADSKPMQRIENTLTVGLPGFALHQEVLSLAENRRIIEQLLSELCQTPLAVVYATLPEPAPPPAPGDSASSKDSAPPIVQDIVHLFNATILNRPQST